MGTKNVLNAIIAKLQGKQKRTLPLVFGAPAQLRALFGNSLRNPQLTEDGMSVEYNVGEHIVVAICPAEDMLVVRSSANFVTPIAVHMSDGVLDEMDQLLVMGQANRIRSAHTAAKDPVKPMLDLGVVKTA